MLAPRVASRMLAAVVLCAASLAGCPKEIVRFPLADPLRTDPDRTNVEHKPKVYVSGMYTDAVDQTSFVPVGKALAVDVPGAAVNVNAMDEVADSSWFTNRIGDRPLSPEEAAEGACTGNPLDPAGPWTVMAAKPDGVNPGFMIRGPQGHLYMLKFDGHSQPERASTADVFGSRVYHAVGFHSPCNTVVHFDPQILKMGTEASTTDAKGARTTMTMADVEKVLAAANTLEDGRLRALASRFVSGKPLGPWTYQGTRRDDPNDVIRHEDRREIRGARLVAAWLSHFDAREQNTMDMWVEEDRRSYVEHYYIDFGDSLGWDFVNDDFARRYGHSYYMDASLVMADSFTFGTIARPWEDAQISELAPAFGYFDVEHFDPVRWKTGFPNPAFARMQDEDGAWMARILAQLTDEHIRAMLDESQLSDAAQDQELFRTLLGRRDKLLGHYLTVRSPLTGFETRGTDTGAQLCFEDLALQTGVTDRRLVRYESRMYFDSFDEPRWTRHEYADRKLPDGDLCVDLVHDGQRPSAGHPGTPADSPQRYAILDLLVTTEPGHGAIPPARLHFYDLGDEGFRLVAIERPGDESPPGGK